MKVSQILVWKNERKDGSEFPVEISARIIEIKDSKYIQSIIKDISERKKNEEIIKNTLSEKEDLLDKLEIKNKELENLINIISHDLRSPLINTLGFSQQLEIISNELTDKIKAMSIGEKDNKLINSYFIEKIPSYLSYIKKSSLKMDALIKGLLLVSRAGRMPLNLNKINMKVLINEIISTFLFQIKETDAEIVADEIPDCIGDYIQINQVFSNLIDNAIKYRDKNKKLIIHISGNKKKNNIVYSIKDSGIGIPKEYQEKVWQIFTRITADPDIPGEGIGLALVLNIIKRHNGKIWIESEPDSGTAFFIQLPLKINKKLIN